MREFNEHAKAVLKRSEERTINMDEPYTIRDDSGNIGRSKRDADAAKDGKALDARCEMCDWSKKTPSLSFVPAHRPGRVVWDIVSSRYLCNICRGEATYNSRAKILEALQEKLDNLLEYNDDNGVGSTRLTRHYSRSYLDTIDGQLVEVKVYKPSHKALNR